MEWLPFAFITASVILLSLYSLIKTAVKNGIKEAHRELKGDNNNVV